MIRSISYGGGVQSTALLVLAITGRIDFDVALFANVGDDSEHPASIDYVRNIATPYAQAHGFALHELHPQRRGEPTTIYQEITRPDSGRDVIPVYGTIGAPMSRTCTADFKIKTIGRWLKANGATRTNPATVAIGISTDEIERAGRGKEEPGQTRTYPLLDLGLSRDQCTKVIRDAGLPVPPKSSCYFCPFHRPLVWAEMRRDEPHLFDQAQALEDHMNERNTRRGRPPVYLTRYGKRLTDAIPEAQASLFGDTMGAEQCDSGYCWT